MPARFDYYARDQRRMDECRTAMAGMMESQLGLEAREGLYYSE